MTALPASRAEIARLVPHQGAMCLLDRVVACDAAGIVCVASGHHDVAHPLRRDDGLPAICGVEYALQAMALHGALTDGAPQGVGFLVGLSAVSMPATRLDTVPGELRIVATALARESRGFIYDVAISGGGQALLSGRATIMLA